MASPQRPRPPRRRFTKLAIVALLCAAAVGGGWQLRAADARSSRALAGAELAAFERCLLGEPLRENEALAGRLRGVELAVALERGAREQDAPVGTPEVADAPDGGAADDGGAAPKPPSAADAVTVPDPPPPSGWPSRCAPFADTLARRLESAALGRDRTLDALRDALPTRARLGLPSAFMPSEAAALATAVAKANLPRPGQAPTNEPPPPALEPPIATTDLAPLGKGRLRVSSEPGRATPAMATDVLATRTLRLLVRDAGTRLCTLEADDPKGPYATARCGALPEWSDSAEAGLPRLVNLDDGAPTALFVRKRAGDATGPSAQAHGAVILSPGATKAIPIAPYADDASAFVAKDGAYILASSAFHALVRVGAVDKLQTHDVADAVQEGESVRALDASTETSIAAFGWVFWNDRATTHAPSAPVDPRRRFWGRRVQPALAPRPVDLGSATSTSPVALIGGCRGGGRTALVFGADAQQAKEKQTVRVVMAEGAADFRGLDAEVGATTPHVTCAPDIVVVTSVSRADDKGQVAVIESRCKVDGCVARRSAPMALQAADEFDAATTDAGVALVWKMRADRVTSPARGVAFARVAPLDKLGATLPRPLVDNQRRGGFDVEHVHLVARGPVALVALESGGQSPATRAVRIDSTGAVSPVHVEETKW